MLGVRLPPMHSPIADGCQQFTEDTAGTDIPWMG